MFLVIWAFSVAAAFKHARASAASAPEAMASSSFAVVPSLYKVLECVTHWLESTVKTFMHRTRRLTEPNSLSIHSRQHAQWNFELDIFLLPDSPWCVLPNMPVIVDLPIEVDDRPIWDQLREGKARCCDFTVVAMLRFMVEQIRWINFRTVCTLLATFRYDGLGDTLPVSGLLLGLSHLAQYAIGVCVAVIKAGY